MTLAVTQPVDVAVDTGRNTYRINPVHRFVLVVLLVLGASFSAMTVAPQAHAASGQLTSFDTRMLELMNNARWNAGLPVLKSASGLTSLSLWWSGQLADGATGYALQHNPNAFEQTLSHGASNRTSWAENVAKWNPTSVTADQIFDAYWNSPGHRANILGASYRYVGVASVSGSNGISFNTMTFTDKVDRPDVVEWLKTSYNPTIYALSNGSHHAASYPEWAGAGFPSPKATYTEYVHYPWSNSIYAVTFWSDGWQWDRLDFNSWATAGYPNPRTAGWIDGSTIWKYANAPEIYITESDGTNHALTYAEWEATPFRQPAIR